MTSDFQHQLLRQIAHSLQSCPARNVDTLRFPDERSRKDSVLALAARANFYHHSPAVRNALDRELIDLEPYLEGLDWLYTRLSDALSKQTLVEIICFRVLGARHARIAAVHDKFWHAVEIANGPAIATGKTQQIPTMDGWLDDFDLTGQGWPVKLRAHKLNVINTFLLEQYRYQASGLDIHASTGDIVVDGGGCWGDTALYFAQKAGPTGQVHVFEFSPANLVLMHRNLAQNPDLQQRIHLVQHPVWSVSGETVCFDEAGPGTALGTGGLQASSLSIDDWAIQSAVPRIDFIKLDIEGAEQHALRGAREVIQKHKPTLAVAVYHSLSDFAEIPRLIDSITPGYRFHLGHYTIHSEEAILFAVHE